MAKTISEQYIISWPDVDLQDNFTFSVMLPDGRFSFLFKYINERWNVWCTVPDGTTREAGAEPNVVNWTGFIDYGLVFASDAPEISHDELFNSKLVLIKWA